MTDIIRTLDTIHNEQASALVVEASAKDELDAAQAEYDKLLKQFEAQHKDVVERLASAKEKHTQAKASYKKLDDEARDLLRANKWEKLPLSYSQKRIKKVVYTEKILFDAALKHCHHILSIDEKKLEKFVFGMAEEVKTTSSGEKLAEPYFSLPEYIRDLLPSLHVNFDYQPNISKPKLKQSAPEDVPVFVEDETAFDVSLDVESDTSEVLTIDLKDVEAAIQSQPLDAVGPKSDTEQPIGKVSVTNTDTIDIDDNPFDPPTATDEQAAADVSPETKQKLADSLGSGKKRRV